MSWTHSDHEASAAEAIARGVIRATLNDLAKVPEPQQSSEHQARVSALSVLNRAAGLQAVVQIPWTPGLYQPPIDPPVEPPDETYTNTVHVTAGTRTVTPLADTLYLPEPGWDGVMVGGTERYAFRSDAAKVGIKGFTVKGYQNPNQYGAVQIDGDDWTVEDCEAAENNGVGIKVNDNMENGSWISNAVVRRCHIHHNRQLGFGTNHVNGGGLYDSIVEFNNPDGAVDWGWEAGGSKFQRSKDYACVGSTFRNNHGPGIWYDLDNTGSLIEDNVSEDNLASGIFYEISGSATIRKNTVRRNGYGHTQWLWGGGITVATSYDVLVEENLVEGNYNGITVTRQSRGPGRTARNIAFKRNTVTHQGARLGALNRSGAVDDNGDDAMYPTITFEGDTYDAGHMFGWEGQWGDLAWWQQFHPQDG